jgi:16S rRNA (cytosine967-C5)-methyltransferase
VPKVEDYKSYKDSVNASEYQKQFVREAYRLLKPGGRLVYSTCTLTDVENEAVVEYALNIGFKLEDYEVKSSRGKKGDYGIRFTPHRDRTPGFFISLKLVK